MERYMAKNNIIRISKKFKIYLAYISSILIVAILAGTVISIEKSEFSNIAR